MTALRWIARILASLAVLALVAYYGARLHDGPLGLIPGGPLQAGEVVAEPVPDWEFARDTGEIALQLDSQEQSRTVRFLVLDGHGYVPCRLGFDIWHRQAIVNGAARLRIEGKLYPVTLSKLDDTIAQQMSDRVRMELARKYGELPSPEAAVWLFQVTTRIPAA
jgi:hypothetical protein